MALFDTNSGLSGLLGDLGDYGFGLPKNTGGLIGNADVDAINKRALMSGGINALLTYFATPKNLNTGSALPYLGKAALAGYNTSQDVVDKALNTAYRNRILAGKDDNIRTIKQDRFEITQEKQPDGSYKEIARSALDAPAKEQPLDIERLISIKDKLTAENPNNPNIPIYDDLIQNARIKKDGLNINLGSPVAGVDPTTGQPVFFQASRTGGKPEIVPGIVPKAGEAQTKQIGGIDSLNSAISSYKDQLKTWSPTDAADPNKRAKMQTYYNNMMLQAKEAFNLGVLNGNDYTILTDVIADPTSAKGITYGAFGALEGQADALSELMQRTKQSLQGGKGIKPKENAPQGNQPKVIKFDSKGQRIN